MILIKNKRIYKKMKFKMKRNKKENRKNKKIKMRKNKLENRTKKKIKQLNQINKEQRTKFHPIINPSKKK